MQTSLLAPLLGNSTKSTIIQLLSEKSLTLKELHNQIEKTNSKSITYQATHKAVSEMINEEILIKNLNKKIEINKAWVEKINTFTVTLNSKIDSPKENLPGKSETYYFDNFVEYARFTIRFFIDAPNPGNKEGVCILRHSWPLFGMSTRDYELLKKLFSETTFYEIVKNNTPLDVAFGKTVEQIGKKVKLPVKYESNCEVVVKGDQVYQAFYTEDFIKTFDTLYNQYTTMNDTVMNELITKIMAPKTKITVNIFKDKETAEKIRKEVLVQFKKKN
ncbi:MAG: hypothetical protein WC746_01795 [archaeon]|jgi:hypothetical protein